MGTKLFVGNLAYSITEQELREAFAQSGRTVQSVRIAVDRETQRPRGFAFIEVATDADAESAIRELNGQMLAGRSVFVEKAQERVPGAPRSPRPPRPNAGPGRGPGGGGPPFGGPPRGRAPMADAIPQREEQRRRQARPERKSEQKKKTSGRPREEERERGKWRWDGKDDY